ncbi:MAG: ATP-dependent DNA helicase RecG [Bacteroidetes bacterium]|nr:ATP-dependent DNA helicase RecG [Bacteroidota bacterium]
MTGFFETRIEFLKGVGPAKSALLNKELNIFTYADLIQHYPFRYEDRTKFYKISELKDGMPFVQIKGFLTFLETAGYGRKKRLIARIKDDTGELELVWFKGLQWVQKKLQPGVEYVAFGKPVIYGHGKLNMAHPELDIVTPQHDTSGYLQPVYSTTEKLKSKFLDSRTLMKLQAVLLEKAVNHIHETLPYAVLQSFKLIPKKEAMIQIHFPDNHQMLQKALFRLKFEELFYIQLKLLQMKVSRMEKYKGMVFSKTNLITEFYNKHLLFELTCAQKKVIREIYRDMRSGKQMNRLLQGDVGSGKTIVAFLCMLLAINGGAQAAMMAPTETLAIQHFNGLKPLALKMGLHMGLLTGSTKTSERKIIHQMLLDGNLHILTGTHALLEDVVRFKNLGLAVIDEQHRFGVAQRSKLWQKNSNYYPHMLVMTATPIPRTLAMTLYGDLDVSVIDEMPAGRKPVKTLHRYDSMRLKVFGFMKEEIRKGSQIYVVYPLIEESEKSDLKDLMDGYESICRAFPGIPVSIVHGKMKPDAKDYEMQRFIKGETKIMVATTVIEVGVDVSNAAVMVIENAERFGLAQLHQLRGRVGRGFRQSWCILMTDYKLSKDARIRIETMIRTTDGFDIADVDLKLRGPGDLMGTQQSGVLDLLLADLGKDAVILQTARDAAILLLEKDPQLSSPENSPIRKHIDSLKKTVVNWSRIS